MHMAAARLGCKRTMVGAVHTAAARLGCKRTMVGAVHMAAARLGCKRTMVGTGWANSQTGCMSRLRKCYSHLSGGSFQAGKV